MSRNNALESKSKEHSFIATLGLMMAGSIIDPIVEAAVTPTSVATLMQGKQPALVTQSYLHEKLDRTPTADTGETKTENWDDAHMGYEGLSKFVVRFKDTKSGDDAIILVLR